MKNLDVLDYTALVVAFCSLFFGYFVFFKKRKMSDRLLSMNVMYTLQSLAIFFVLNGKLERGLVLRILILCFVTSYFFTALLFVIKIAQAGDSAEKFFLSLLVTFIFGIVISVVVHKTVSADWRYTVDVCIGSLLVFFFYIFSFWYNLRRQTREGKGNETKKRMDGTKKKRPFS